MINIIIVLLSFILLLQIYFKFKIIKIFFIQTCKENIFNFLPLFILIIIKTYYESLSFNFFSNSNFMLITLILWSSLILKAITFHVKILKQEQIKPILEKVTVYILGLVFSCIFLALELSFEEKNPNQSLKYFVAINFFYFIFTFIQICDLKNKVREISDSVKNELLPQYKQYIENILKGINDIEMEIVQKYEEKIDILSNKELYDIFSKIEEKLNEVKENNSEESILIFKEIEELHIKRQEIQEEINRNIGEKEKEIENLKRTKEFANNQKNNFENLIQDTNNFLYEIENTEI